MTPSDWPGNMSRSALIERVNELEKVRDALNRHNDKLNDDMARVKKDRDEYLMIATTCCKPAMAELVKAEKLIKKMKAALKFHACPDDGSLDTKCWHLGNHKCPARRLSGS